MATALFIKTEDVLRNSIMDGNIDVDKYIQFIKLAQEIDIQNITGTSLYNKFSTLISSGTIDDAANAKYKTLLNEQVAIIPFIAYQIRQGGIFKHTSESAETVSRNEVDFLVEKARTNAEWYKRRFQSYMDFNQSNFPEFYNNTNDEISPSSEETFNGWVL